MHLFPPRIRIYPCTLLQSDSSPSSRKKTSQTMQWGSDCGEHPPHSNNEMICSLCKCTSFLLVQEMAFKLHTSHLHAEVLYCCQAIAVSSQIN